MNKVTQQDYDKLKKEYEKNKKKLDQAIKNDERRKK